MKRCNCCFELYDESQHNACPHCNFKDGMSGKELYFLFPGTILNDRYIIGDSVGAGGFGITYKAWDQKLQVAVAVKEYYPTGIVNRAPGTPDVKIYAQSRMAEFQEGIDGFLEEARRMAKFNGSRNIVNVYDFFEENNTAYIVMEFLDGVGLNTFLRDNELDYESSLEIIRIVCDALKTVHADGIIHRDISPDNIFLCTDGTVKLIDFGAARFSENRERLMTIILKPGFAPPEQYETVNKQGPWTDIYALGATLYMMLTREKPDESTNRKIKDELPSPHELDPGIDENISNAIMKAMAIEVSLRFHTVEEFEKALFGGKKVLPVEVEKKRRKRRRFTGISIAILLLAAVGIYFGVNVEEQKEEETLPDATLRVWYALSGDENADEGKEEAFQSIIADFTASFENVTIECNGVLREEYEKAIREAAEQKGEVGLFESTDLSSEYLNTMALDLSTIVVSEDARKCYALNQYDTYFEEKNQIPLGFYAPAVYYNKTVTEFSGDTVSKLASLLEVEGDMEYFVAVNEQMEDEFIASFGEDAIDGKKVKLVKNMDDFVDGECAFYFSSTEEYLTVQSRLPARYEMLALDTKEILADLTDLYSINQSVTADEKKVALRFLQFLLSDNSQDYLYVRNQDGSNPINKDVLSVVGGVYKELDGFFENASSYTFR